MGGRSPILEETQAQAEAIEKSLKMKQMIINVSL